MRPPRALRQRALLVAAMLLAIGRDARSQGRAGGVTEEEETFQAAEAAFKEGHDDEALRLYEKVNGLNPARAEAWAKRGVIYYKRKEYDAAVEVLGRGQKALPDDPDVGGQLGMTLYRLGKTDAAVALLEAAVVKLPSAFQFQLQLGQHYVKAGDGKKGVAAFEAYFRTRPEAAAPSDVQVRALSGTAYLLNKQYPEAERDLEAVVKQEPKNGAARVSLGAAYAARGEWEKCIATYQRVATEASRQPLISLNLGTCNYKLNRRGEAEKNALAYVSARPADARGWMLLGDIRAEKRELDKALEAYAQAKTAEPGNATLVGLVASREGLALLSLRQFAKAREALQQASKAGSDDIDVLVGLAEASIGAREAKAKLLDFGERLARRAEPGASLAAGRCFYAAEDDARALPAFEAAAVADPDGYRPRGGLRLVLNRLAGGLVAKADLAGAEALLVRAQRIDPSSVVTNRNLGVTLLLEGKYPESEAALRLALGRVDRDAIVNRLLGRALVGEKKREEAIHYYEAAAQSAQTIHGAPLAEVYTELGPLYIEAGRLDSAILVLESAVNDAGSEPVSAPASRNLAIALLRRGLEHLNEAPQSVSALDDITRAAGMRTMLSSRESAALSCAQALATLKVGRPQAALEALGRAQHDGGCQFKAPFDKLGAEFFPAYAAYREPAPTKREQAAKAFQKLLPRATGALVEQLKDLARSSYEFEGYDFYTRGDRKRASLALRNAQRMPGRADHRELDHNLAVVDLDDGNFEAAAKALEVLGNRPPEALLNLGIVRDHEGDSKKALELYKRALERGARAPHLREWIDVKERVFARAQGTAK